MAKRLSSKNKEQILIKFQNGENLEELAEQFGCTKLTISRNLKQKLGDDQYNLINKSNKEGFDTLKDSNNHNLKVSGDKKYDSLDSHIKQNTDSDSEIEFENLINTEAFLEIAPLEYQIDESSRKDLSSIPIDEVVFPKIVFMIVDKKIELETKLLKEYPEWHFLPEADLNQKTIELYSELKDAKRNCKKEQKVIKVVNTQVFRLVAPILISRGISRLVCSDQLIAL